MDMDDLERATIQEPRDDFAEAAVLASVLIQPNLLNMVSKMLRVDDFQERVNRTVYAAMLDLRAKQRPADVTLLVGMLRDTKRYDVRGDGRGVTTGDLLKLFNLLPTPVHCRHYVNRVREMSARRKAVRRGVKLITEGMQ